VLGAELRVGDRAGIGGIIGPRLFGRPVPTGNASVVFVALAIGAVRSGAARAGAAGRRAGHAVRAPSPRST
jgi:hypothetical protein